MLCSAFSVTWKIINSAITTGRLLFNLSGHQDVVRDLSFTTNGSLTLVTASRDKTLRVWDLKKDGMIFTSAREGKLKCGAGPGFFPWL